jgi:hypothetical protein
MKRLPMLIILLLFACPAYSQNKATVFIYRGEYHMTFKKIAPTVFANNKKLAELDDGRYLAVDLEPGVYTFKTGSGSRSEVKLYLEGSATYYIRMDVSAGMMKTQSRLTIVPSQQGEKDIKLYRPIKPEDIKDERVRKDYE